MTNDTTTTPEPAQWAHIPEMARPADIDREAWAEIHRTDGGACFACWCYSCGGRTDRPRIRIRDDRTDAELARIGSDSPDSHRWCFE